MRVGIMQPYFFPYLGYWQLLGAVDRYVVFDDVNFIKKGWINRNRILSSRPGESQFINIPLRQASQNKLIKDICVAASPEELQKLVRTLECVYRRAPFYSETMSVVEECVSLRTKSLGEFLVHTIECVMRYLEIRTELTLSSAIVKDEGLRGQEKILDICRRLGAEEYLNAIGGMELYEEAAFRREGMELNFLKCRDIVYRQFREPFLPNLSILDVMMFNCADRVRGMMGEYDLIQTRRGR